MERFSAGVVLSTGLRMFARITLRLLPVLLIVYAPLVAVIVVSGAHDLGALLLLLEIPIAAIASHAVVQDLRGAPAPAMASVASGLRRTLPALGVMLLVYLVLFALTLAISLPLIDDSELAKLIFVLALLGLIVALYSRWFVAIPAVVVERPGVAGALSRSGELTRGRRPPIAGVIVTMTAGYLAVLVVLYLAVGATFEHDASSVWFRPDDVMPWVMVASLTLYALFGLLRAVLSATAYYLIRTETEAQSPEQLAKIFD